MSDLPSLPVRPVSDQPPDDTADEDQVLDHVKALLEGAMEWLGILDLHAPSYVNGSIDRALSHLASYRQRVLPDERRDGLLTEIEALVHTLDTIEARGDRPDPPARADARDRLLEIAEQHATDTLVIEMIRGAGLPV